MAPRGYPAEFRRKVLDLLESGRKVADIARDLEISEQTIYSWRRQDRIDRGLQAGATTSEKTELAAAQRSIARLQAELAAAQRALELLKGVVPPKVRYAAVRRMAADGHSVQRSCRLLGVAESGYYEWRNRRPSARAVRHTNLTEQIRAIHTASRGVYGARRVHAELVLGHGITVGHGQVELLMTRAGLAGLPGRRKWKHAKPDTYASDLVNRDFARSRANALWVTDITEHPTREGKAYCAVVLDTYSRRVVGWSIDASPTAALVTNALGMAIDNRRDINGTVIHIDQGVQFGSWAFTERAKASRLVPSMGSIGDCYDNGMMESFWSRMQVELLNRRRWRTRIELANAIFEYLEIFYNRQRRHSALGYLSPIQFENQPPVA
ncbi:IS3 family transposase [Kineosporia sp. R_H_3]|uniref:IS3 family transposase n=1 Tax=Kineosporia sp. R_H_3 TaxID=1961848 RepID=UPI000B4ADC45|nr:IS3 family transposase [Kineosporia sp. R_H_3]